MSDDIQTFMDCPDWENGVRPKTGKDGGAWGEGDYCHTALGIYSTVCKCSRENKMCPRGYQ